MLKPLGEKLVVEVIEVENKTAGGIVLTSASQEKSNQGAVIAVGNKVNDISVGDTIIFTKYAGTETKFDGKDYLILIQDNVLAVIE